MPTTTTDQAALDSWLATDAADREGMRLGQVPGKLAMAGCGPTIGISLFAPALAALAWFLPLPYANWGVPREAAALLAAVVGGIAGKVLGSRKPALASAQVHSMVAHFTLRDEGRRGRYLVGPNGREFRALLPPGAVHIDGRYRLYYVDLAEVRASEGKSATGQCFALGLEYVGEGTGTSLA